MSALEVKLLDGLRRTASGCWEWTGRADDDGYGSLARDRTHRVAFRLYCGPVDGVCVCHSCDNRRCCNPTHLFAWTHADNAHDRDRKGRGPRGERNHAAKLTADTVRRIRADLAAGMTQRQAAKKYGMHRGNVSHIARRKSWSHVA